MEERRGDLSEGGTRCLQDLYRPAVEASRVWPTRSKQEEPEEGGGRIQELESWSNTSSSEEEEEEE